MPSNIDASHAATTPPLISPAPRPVVVGISGASCSGKTWLANMIRDQQPEVCEIIDLDGYYRDVNEVQSLEHGHDNPASINFERVLEDLTRLKSGQAVRLPVYCYEQHATTGTRECQPRPILLLEGIFAFAHPALRDQIDIKIWIETETDLLFHRRVERDTVRGRRSLDEIQSRYRRDVIPGFQKFIRPLREFADVIIGNDGRDQHSVPLIAKLVLAYVERLSDDVAG